VCRDSIHNEVIAKQTGKIEILKDIEEKEKVM
jgi:hypothetical protein